MSGGFGFLKYKEQAQVQRFQNTDVEYRTSWSNIWDILKAYVTTERRHATPESPIPVKSMNLQSLLAGYEDELYRLGHSTVLMRLGGKFFLTDPVFSERASPVSWAGPKRFHQSPIALDQIPELRAVIISHNHYDHLDKKSIKALDSRVETFVVPMGVSRQLIKWGVDQNKIVELNWWQSIQFDDIEVVATPAQHFSGRGLFDRDKTLWASWVIKSSETRLFFSGDTGYFEGFKEIGEKYGPFDVTLMEMGAYNPLWKEIHMLPEQSVKAHFDLKGKAFLPIHNGTFDLSLHDWFEPLELSYQLTKNTGTTLLTPVFGEAVSLKSPKNSLAWWREDYQSDTQDTFEVVMER